MKRLYSLFAAMALAGCSSLPLGGDGSKEVKLEFHADHTFIAPERDVIAKAANDWRSATNGLANIVVVYDATDKICETKNCIHKLSSDDPATMEADVQACMGLFPCVLGWTTHTNHEKSEDPIELDLVYDRYDSPETAEITIAHELGHALGLKHVPYAHALMYPAENPRQLGCITQVDVSEFCKVNHCGTHKLNPCD